MSGRLPGEPDLLRTAAFNSGYRAEARTVARHFLDTFETSEAVVVPSGSCTAMIAHHFSELFQKEPETLARVHSLESRVYEFSTYLTEVAGVEDVGARLDRIVTFHDGCHGLRELGVKDAPRRLLANVRGLELREMAPAEECCGFGGTFAVKFPELSGAMARTKIDAIQRTGAATVVSGDPSCLMQIQGALSRAGSSIGTLHLARSPRQPLILLYVHRIRTKIARGAGRRQAPVGYLHGDRAAQGEARRSGLRRCSARLSGVALARQRP
ncbi:MAG: (Fe-S)-binding protein [Ignavibacteriota bacterium]